MAFQKRNLRQSQRKKTIIKTVSSWWKKGKEAFLRLVSPQDFPEVFVKPFSTPKKPLGSSDESFLSPQTDILEKNEEKEEFPEKAVLSTVPEQLAQKAPVRNFEAAEKMRLRRSWRMMFLFISLCIGVIILFLNDFLSSSSFSSLQQRIIVSTLGEDLPTDTHGLTNILLLGVGGKGHSGENLSDSMILVSIDPRIHSISMLSLPRDLYVRYEIEGETRSGRINQVFRDGINYWRLKEPDEEMQRRKAIVYVKDVMTRITGYEIQKFAVVDFQGFVDLVDALGGVTIDVDKKIYDSTYPDGNYGYEVFSLNAGVQELNGEMALKYVRSRHNTSDFDRSRRQKQVIAAIKEEAIEKGVLTDPQKIRQFLGIIEENFWSDLTWGEMVSLGGEAFNVPSSSIFAGGVNDNPDSGSGGFLYTPPREEFENASVLLPYLTGEKNPYSQIQFFAEVLFENRGFLLGEPKLAILNTTKRAGLANTVSQHFSRYGIPVGDIGNSDVSREVTTVEYLNTPEISALIPLLKRKISAVFLPINPVSLPPESLPKYPITIYIGEDFSANDYRGTLLRAPLPRASLPETPE